MKQLYSTLALLLVVAAVGAWIWFQERGPIAESGSTILLRSDPSRVASLVLQRPDGKRLSLSRQGDDWQVRQEGVGPIAVPADSEVVKTLLDAVQLVQSAAIVENANADQLKSFGLTRPRSTLLVDDSKIEFGTKPSFDNSRVYARVTSTQSGGASRVALVPSSLAEFATKTFNDWRDKSALRFTAQDASQLEINAPAIRAKFERTRKGEEGVPDEWSVSSPLSARADAGTIVSFLQQLSQSKVLRFLEDDPKNLAKWGLAKPVATVVITTDEGASTLRIGKTISGGRAAQNDVSKTIFVVPDTLLGLASRPLREWRDRIVLRFETEDLDGLRVAARGQSAEFARDENDEKLRWQRTDAKGKAQSKEGAHQSALDVLFGAQGLAAIDFIDKSQAPNTYGFDKPVLEIRLSSQDWSEPKTIQIGGKSNKLYARLLNGSTPEATTYVLSPNSLQPFETALNVLFSSPAKTSSSRASSTSKLRR